MKSITFPPYMNNVKFKNIYCKYFYLICVLIFLNIFMFTKKIENLLTIL